MSQDASSKPNNPQEIDLDDLEVEILIIAKNANGMTQAANFLSRRGWPTTVLSNVGRAIEHISDKQPDFILISFNHTHPAVLKLPDLITRTLVMLKLWTRSQPLA
jgi:DNA-binding NtrC family response regulator